MVDSAKIVKNKQWMLFTGGFAAFIAILVFGMWISDPNKGKPTPMEVARLEAQEVKTSYKARSVDAVTPQERWIAKSEQELAAYKAENRQLKQDQAILQRKLEEIEKLIRSGDLNASVVQRSQPNNNASAEGLPPAPTGLDVPVVPPGTAETDNDINKKEEIVDKVLPPSPQRQNKGPNSTGSNIQVFEFDDEENQNASEKTYKNISHYIPSGGFGKIVLLSGADAPTGGEADANPVPVLMRLIDHGTLPNFFKSEIQDCHLTGAAVGDLASERVKIRTEKLSCVLLNGDVIDVAVKGWINGEDGKEGFRGRVVEKSGALLARTFVAGTMSGIGNNVAMQYQNISQSALGTVTSIDPDDVGKAGAATGLSNSMEKLADYYMDRANEMYPVIELGAQRIGEFVLQEGVDLERNIIGNMKG